MLLSLAGARNGATLNTVPAVRRALVVVALGLAVVIAVGVTVTWRTGRVPLSGCRLTSVDPDEYFAGNRTILDTLPSFPGAKRIRTSSWAASVADSCVPRENSGPYDAYVTSEVFTLPVSGRPLIPVPWYAIDRFGNRAPAQAPAALVYLDGELRESGWRGGGMGSCCATTYKNGTAALNETVTSTAYEKGAAALNVTVTYDGAGQYEIG
jgi:hypothetical protein